MIDISTEHLIAVLEVPRLLPLRRNGRRVHVSAVYRWILRGVRGVRLEAVRIGGTSYTSTEALQRFAEQQRMGRPDASTLSSTTTTRQKQIDQATHRVEAILGLDRCKKDRD